MLILHNLENSTLAEPRRMHKLSDKEANRVASNPHTQALKVQLGIFSCDEQNSTNE